MQARQLVPSSETQTNDGHLEVIVKSTKIRNVMTSEQDPIRSYFLLLQLEDQEGTTRSQKYRTDLQRQIYRSEDLIFEKNVFKFAGCNPYEKITIRIACFQVEQRRKKDIADMSAMSIIQEQDNLAEQYHGNQQAKLIADSEIMGTGLLKFDIFDETERNLDGIAGQPILENNPATSSEINKQIKLFGVVTDESKESIKSSHKEVGQLYLTLHFKVNNFDFQLFQESRLVQKHFFDAFQKDEDQIKFHLARVEELLALRTSQYQKTVELYDEKSATLFESVSELARLRFIKESEEKEMEALEARLFRL